MKPVQMCGCWNERYRRQKKKMQRCMKIMCVGLLKKEDFDMMKERYIQNLQELRDELQAAKQKQRMLEKKADRYMDMVNNLEPYLYERSFNEKLVQELVEYVEVYKNGNIHVCFRCDDKFQQIIELIEGVKSAEERIIS